MLRGGHISIILLPIVNMSTTNGSSRDTTIDGGIVDDNEGDTVVIGKRVLPKLDWVWLNYQGENHDSHRLLDHRAKNGHCDLCFRELNKLPQMNQSEKSMRRRSKKK